MPDEKNNRQVVQAEVEPSMRDDFRAKWKSDNFNTEAEAIRYIIRQYILSGIPCQAKSPEVTA